MLEPHGWVKTYAKILYDGKTQGSGFFVEHRGVTNRPYFVTVRHVVTGLPERFFRDERLTLRLKKRDGNQSGTFDFKKTRGLPFCVYHQDDSVDVAVFPLGNYDELAGQGYDVRPAVYSESASSARIPMSDTPAGASPRILTGHDYETYGIEPGCEVMVLGALASFEANLADKDEFLVSFRKGIVSAMPSCEMKLLEGGQTRMFILDCPVMNADSGGPVFALVPERLPDGRVSQKRPHLLGMTVSFLDDRSFSRVVPDRETVKITDMRENSGLSFMLPADRIVEILKQIETGALAGSAFSTSAPL